ncbi:MAG: FixH family protein [Parvularculaceae bacterium]|nr:FixH family protein [Parvularculaceae bacterium]
MRTPFQLTGGHVLAALLGFFALIVAANASFIYFAVKTFPGEREKKSYRQGIHYNDALGARAAQEALGWRAAIESVVRDGEAVTLVVTFAGRNAAPLDSLALAGRVVRPASNEGEQAFSFAPSGAGRYTAVINAASGAFDLTVAASSSAGEQFQFTNRVIFP